MRSRKIIKKFIQSAVILLLLVLAFPATAFLLLQSNRIQASITRNIMEAVSESLNTKFTIRSVEFTFLYRIRLHDVYLQDLSGDTLLHAKSITAGIRHINPVQRDISIGSLNFDKAYLALVIDSASNLNINYFIDILRGDGPKKGQGAWHIGFNNLKLHDSRFSLRNYYYQPVEYGMNYTHISVYNLEANLKRFNPSKDSLSFFVKSLGFREQSGLTVNSLTSEFSQSKTFLSFRNISLKTPDSEIHGDEISLLFKQWRDFKAGSFISLVKLRVSLSQTRFNVHDLGYFAPVFRDISQQFILSGRVTGPVNNLKGKELSLALGNNTKLLGELKFEGLPNLRETFIIADIQELTTSASDLKALESILHRPIKLPEQFGKLGVVRYQGNFTGFINDFVAYGTFHTSLGILNTDLLFRPDTSNVLGFEGKLNVIEFELGSLLDAKENLGKISLTATIKGVTLAGKSINATLKGIIEQFEFRQYNYTNITLSGNLQNKTYNGSVNIHDPNIDLEFLGKVNLSDSVPVFDFTANITDANLYALNINRSDPSFRASCYLIANARGNSINSLNGEIKLLNSLFVARDKQLQIYDLSIVAANKSGNNLIQLRSDFLDADLEGSFELTRSGEALRQFLYAYLPVLFDTTDMSTGPLENTINLQATIKQAKPVLDFFLPGYSISENSTLRLTYTPETQKTFLNFHASRISAKSLSWDEVNVTLDGNADLLSLEAGGDKFVIGNRIRLENFTIYTNAADDTTGIQLRWNNWQDLQYRGAIHALAKFDRRTDNQNMQIELDVNPSRFITNDTIWQIQPGRISIDSTSIFFQNLAIIHNNEYFRMDGRISENPADDLSVLFNHFNLANLNGVTSPSGFNLGGILSGKATLSDLYSDVLFTSLLNIDSLNINGEMLGSTMINSTWDDERKAVRLDAHAMRDNLRTIGVKGAYLPAENGRLDFDLELEKLRMNLFNPYIKVVFNDLRGIASGKASLTGTTARPMLNGEFNLQKTSFTVNYLKTRYSFSDKVQIENNNIYFKNIRIYDPKGNSAYLNGAIRNRYLKNFGLDLNIRSQNFLCMNTTLADNKQFYGTAYATGLIKISGPFKNITMDISAKTDKNTSIKIPLSSAGELNDYPFITIFNEAQDNSDEAAGKDYQVDLSGMQINFDLEVTPDAEVQIIFDPKLGDIIKGKGSGNLDMKINTTGNFLMFGDYTIEEGDYLFTLQNIINRKLTIEPGGKVQWNGDPLNATVDIVATYRTKGTLSDLLGTEEDQKINVDSRITMTGKLMSPEVKYDIYLPNADESTRLKVNSAITSSEELSRQFIALLTLNRFVLSSNRTGQSLANSSGSVYSGAAGVNASEFLSNQLSNWLSQINNELDVDINYRSDQELKSDEVQVALSYQLFNDRLTINGSVDMATNATKDASDEIVGEFDIDYKLTPTGKFRLKTYNHVNNDLTQENSTYTQGVGFTYKEEFSTLGELWRKYFGFMYGKKEENADLESPETPK